MTNEELNKWTAELEGEAVARRVDQIIAGFIGKVTNTDALKETIASAQKYTKYTLPTGNFTDDMNTAIEVWRAAGFNVSIQAAWRHRGRHPYTVTMFGKTYFGNTLTEAVSIALKASLKVKQNFNNYNLKTENEEMKHE